MVVFRLASKGRIHHAVRTPVEIPSLEGFGLISRIRPALIPTAAGNLWNISRNRPLPRNECSGSKEGLRRFVQNGIIGYSQLYFHCRTLLTGPDNHRQTFYNCLAAPRQLPWKRHYGGRLASHLLFAWNHGLLYAAHFGKDLLLSAGFQNTSANRPAGGRRQFRP